MKLSLKTQKTIARVLSVQVSSCEEMVESRRKRGDDCEFWLNRREYFQRYLDALEDLPSEEIPLLIENLHDRRTSYIRSARAAKEEGYGVYFWKHNVHVARQLTDAIIELKMALIAEDSVIENAEATPAPRIVETIKLISRIKAAREGALELAPEDAHARQSYLVGALMGILSNCVGVEYLTLQMLTLPEKEKEFA